MKLVFLVGGLGHVARRVSGVLPVFITPEEWKGQLPKKVVLARLAKAFGKDRKFRDHEADAVGMGLAAQGGL